MKAFFYYAGFLSYQALSTVFVEEYYNLGPNESSFVVSLLYIGSICVAPIVGYLSDNFGKRPLLLFLSLLSAIVPFSIMASTNRVSIVFLTIMLGKVFCVNLSQKK